MRAIWKFPLELEDTQRIRMPYGARPLSVQVQYGRPCLWALVDVESRITEQTIIIYGTGHPISLAGAGVDSFIGTFQLDEGQLVFHVFYLGEVVAVE